MSTIPLKHEADESVAERADSIVENEAGALDLRWFVFVGHSASFFRISISVV